MGLPQPGIFALGNLAHAYLEFDAAGASPLELTAALASLAQEQTTMSGVTVVVGLQPELWATVAPASAVQGLTGFTEPVEGADGFTMPATQGACALWLAAPRYDLVFDATVQAVARLRSVATLATETVGWSHRGDIDLTGFIDGTENPAISLAPGMVLVPAGQPGAGGSVLLLQKWAHNGPAWDALSVHDQEQVIGRTKPDSVELDPRPETSHVARTDQDEFAHILRRNTAYGTASDHGTVFVGFSATKDDQHRMLVSMAGANGPRDALTRFTTPLTGAYYFVPSVEDLGAFGPPEDDD
jgi:putative iron-dependent peroxidase